MIDARKLVADASFGPEALKALCQAFDDAWKEVSPQISQDEKVIEAARLRLATMVLTVATSNSHDPQHIKSAALSLMNAGGKVQSG